MRPVDHGDQRPRDRHVRRIRGGGRAIAHLEIPERPADVHDAGDAAREPDPEGVGKARLVACDLVGVGHDRVEIRRVRARVEIAGLEEVHVRVHQPGDDVLAAAVDDRRALGQLDRRARQHRLDLA